METNCQYESSESSKGACDGGEPCGDPVKPGSDFCPRHRRYILLLATLEGIRQGRGIEVAR
jgi:hypothetical protein